MIQADKIGTLLKENDIHHLRIMDRSGANVILDISGATPEEAFDKFMSYAEMLAGYQHLTIKAANEAQFKGSWTGSKIWKVFYPGAATPSTISAPTQSGSYSKEYLETSIALATIKMQMEFDKKERELEKKFSTGDEDKYFKYAPLFAGLLGMTDEQMLKKLQLCSMAGGLSGTNNFTPGVQQNKLVVQGTEAEKEKFVEDIVPKIYEKVDKDKFIAVLKSLNEQPEFIEAAYAYMTMNTPAKTSINGLDSNTKDVSKNFDSDIYLGYIGSVND
jgi:hypothetical protein